MTAVRRALFVFLLAARAIPGSVLTAWQFEAVLTLAGVPRVDGLLMAKSRRP